MTDILESLESPEFRETDVPLDLLMKLLHLRFAFTSEYSSPEDRAEAKTDIVASIKEHNMAPYHALVSEIIGSVLTDAEISAMNEVNAAKVVELDAKIQDARDNLGDVEVREALLAKCEFYGSIGDVAECVKLCSECNEKTLAVGPKMDLCFLRIRLGLASSDHGITASALKDANALIGNGDWERRNRLKVYEGVYSVFVRNFEKGSKMLLDALSTFAATELISFKDYILLTAVSSLVTLDRAGLNKHVVDCPEILAGNISQVNDMVSSINKCKYSQVFPALAGICHLLRKNVFLVSHVNYVFREVRVRAFNQFLDSYSSVTLKSMALSFDIPVSVLDQMMYTLISNERLACKIDRVSGNVLTYRGDHINFMYHKIVKEGDCLLSKLQKLSRVAEL